MAVPDREAIRKGLDRLGADEVRKRMQLGAYASNKIPVVEAWLDEHGVGETPVVADEPSLTDRYLDRLKRQRWIALLIVAVTIVGGIAQFTDAVTKISGAVGIFRPTTPLPVIPGDSGWLLLGNLDVAGNAYIWGPHYKVENSLYQGRSLTPRKGELLRLLAERNVIIPGYKTTGLKRQLSPPWQLNVLTDDDYTGVKLPKNGVVEVRDVSLGSYPDQPIVVWVRVAVPPK